MQIVALVLIVIIGIVLFVVFSNFFKKGEKETKESSGRPNYTSEEPAANAENQKENAEENTSRPPDTAPPYRFNGFPSKTISYATKKTFIGLQTDEKAVCRYETVSGFSYYSMNRFFNNTNSTLHSTEVGGLSEGQGYVYYVKCADEAGNVNTDDFIIAFGVEKADDYTPPVIRNPYPAGDILPSGTTQILMSVSTDEPASCRYSAIQGTAYNSMSSTLSTNDAKRYHTATVRNLWAGQSYEYFVRCKDLEGNANTGDVMIYFSVSP